VKGSVLAMAVEDANGKIFVAKSQTFTSGLAAMAFGLKCVTFSDGRTNTTCRSTAIGSGRA